jgi:hypothetical protein
VGESYASGTAQQEDPMGAGAALADARLGGSGADIRAPRRADDESTVGGRMRHRRSAANGWTTRTIIYMCA